MSDTLTIAATPAAPTPAATPAPAPAPTPAAAPPTAPSPGQPPAAPAPEPALLAGKFKDEAALAQGLREIDKALGLDPAPDDAPQWGESGRYTSPKAAEAAYLEKQKLLQKVTPPSYTDTDISGVLQEAGVTEAELAESWTKDPENPKLTDEQYTKIQKARPGLTRKIIDQNMRDSTRLATLEMEVSLGAALATHGGREKVDTMLSYIGKSANLDKNRLADLNKRLANHSTVGAALDEIAGIYSKAVAGNTPPPANPANGPISAGAFATSTEMHRAINEAETKYGRGNWNQDPQLMARMNVTPKSIRAAV